MKRLAIGLSTAVLALALAVPASSQTAQDDAARGGLVGGAAAGAAIGAAGGPVGAAAGAIIGGAAGAVTGAAITPQDRVYVREYVQTHRARPVRIQQEVRVGVELPRERVTFYEIEGNPRLSSYRYARVNDHTVLVDSSGTVVQIID